MKTEKDSERPPQPPKTNKSFFLGNSTTFQYNTAAMGASNTIYQSAPISNYRRMSLILPLPAKNLPHLPQTTRSCVSLLRIATTRAEKIPAMDRCVTFERHPSAASFSLQPTLYEFFSQRSQTVECMDENSNHGRHGRRFGDY